MTIDNDAPSTPTGGQPNNITLAKDDVDFSWSAATDNQSSGVSYELRLSRELAKVGTAPDNSGASVSGNIPSPAYHAAGMGDGLWYWQVRAIDEAGNTSAWSDVWNVAIHTRAGEGILAGSGSGFIPEANDALLAQLDDSLRQPFIAPSAFTTSDIPNMVNSSAAGTNTEIFRGQMTKYPTMDQNTHVAATPTENGWVLFGLIWYWWVLLLTVFVLMSGKLVAFVKPRRAEA